MNPKLLGCLPEESKPVSKDNSCISAFNTPKEPLVQNLYDMEPDTIEPLAYSFYVMEPNDIDPRNP